MSHTAAHDLLLHCLREEPDASRLEQLLPADWHDLIRQARNHAVLYLLYHRLKTRNLDRHIPEEILQAVRTEYFECAWRNNNLYSDLSNVLKALQAEDIPVIMLKGAYLAQAVYRNIALRSMGDIDILVRKSDLLKAEKTLLNLGYSSTRQDDIETVCSEHHHLPPLVQQELHPIEIHWNISHSTFSFAIDIEKLWHRSRPASIAGADTLTLSPEDLLLHLCLHTSVQHVYLNGLRALCDIQETIRHYQDELDWDTVQNRAREWGAGNAVYLTLDLAKSLLGADVPDELLNKLKPKTGFTPQRVTEAEQLIFNSSDRSITANHQARKLFASRSALKTAELFLQSIFLPRETIAQHYNLPPDSLRIPLYYPVRLKDLLVRYSRTVWRIWRRDNATASQFHQEERWSQLGKWLRTDSRL
jgi:hypothetical protein